MKENSFQTASANYSAEMCCGENAPNLNLLTKDNVLEVRRNFLLNVAYNGKDSNKHIIIVLQYMQQFCDSQFNNN